MITNKTKRSKATAFWECCCSTLQITISKMN